MKYDWPWAARRLFKVVPIINTKFWGSISLKKCWSEHKASLTAFPQARWFDVRASLFLFHFESPGFTFEWSFFRSPLKLKQHSNDWWRPCKKIVVYPLKYSSNGHQTLKGRRLNRCTLFFFLVQGCEEPEQQDVAGSRSTAFHQTARRREPGSHQVSERRAEPGVRSSEEDEMASGGRRGGARRQMPPLRPWRFKILIARGHIVPTLLEMWAASCWASVTR